MARFATVFVITLSALIIASHWPWWQRVVGGGSSLILLYFLSAENFSAEFFYGEKGGRGTLRWNMIPAMEHLPYKTCRVPSNSTIDGGPRHGLPGHLWPAATGRRSPRGPVGGRFDGR